MSDMSKEKKNSKKDVVISIRIPKWLKEEMDRIDINWSEYIRDSIEKKVSIEELKKIWGQIETIKDSMNRR